MALTNTKGIPMTDTLEPRPAESLEVQLTRMEGVLNGVAEKVTDLRARVDRHGIDIASLQLVTQQLASDARSEKQTVVATAKALAEAKAAEEDARRIAAHKSDQTWSPTMRAAVFIGSVVSVAGLVAGILTATLR